MTLTAVTTTAQDPGTGQGTAGAEPTEAGFDLIPVAHGDTVIQEPVAIAASYLSQLTAGRAVRLGSRTSPMAISQARRP